MADVNQWFQNGLQLLIQNGGFKMADSKSVNSKWLTTADSKWRTRNDWSSFMDSKWQFQNGWPKIVVSMVVSKWLTSYYGFKMSNLSWNGIKDGRNSPPGWSKHIDHIIAVDFNKQKREKWNSQFLSEIDIKEHL